MFSTESVQSGMLVKQELLVVVIFRLILCCYSNVIWRDFMSLQSIFCIPYWLNYNVFNLYIIVFIVGVPRRQSHRRSGLANLPSMGAVP